MRHVALIVVTEPYQGVSQQNSQGEIDGAEVVLHQLAALIAQRRSRPRSSVIVSTQSVTLMNQFHPEHVIVDRKDDGSVFRRISPDEVARWVDDYALDELWEKNNIGGRPR